MTTAERLKQIDDAIQAIMTGGQEYSHEGRRVRRAELATLYRERQNLEAQIAEESGANTGVAFFEGR